MAVRIGPPCSIKCLDIPLYRLLLVFELLKLKPARFQVAVEIFDFHDDLRRSVIVGSH